MGGRGETVNIGTDSAAEESAISLPNGVGAIGGLGERFSPDLFTGRGNFSVPVVVPAGRLGMQPQLSPRYSTGGGHPRRADPCARLAHAESGDENAWRSGAESPADQAGPVHHQEPVSAWRGLGNGPPHWRNHHYFSSSEMTSDRIGSS